MKNHWFFKRNGDFEGGGNRQTGRQTDALKVWEGGVAVWRVWGGKEGGQEKEKG